MLTFRSNKIVYYGPHDCSNCGSSVVKMGIEFGGNMFDQPPFPIYPNTEWHVHVCDPKRVLKMAKKVEIFASPTPKHLNSDTTYGR